MASIGRLPGDLLLARVGRLRGSNLIVGSVTNVPPEERESLTALLHKGGRRRLGHLVRGGRHRPPFPEQLMVPPAVN